MGEYRRDARIKFSIACTLEADSWAFLPSGLVFDHQRGLVLACDSNNDRVRVFSSQDGSFVSNLGDGEECNESAQLEFVSNLGEEYTRFVSPEGIALDIEHDRVLVAGGCCIQSLCNQSIFSRIGKRGSRDLEFKYPRGIAIDKHHRRIIIADTHNHRLVFLSSIDLSFLFSVGKRGRQSGEFLFPHGIAVDHDRHRIIVSDHHRVQVLSLIDGSFLFAFGKEGDQPNQAILTSLKECASIIKAESSSPTRTIIDCKHSLTRAITSRPSIATASAHVELHSTSIEVSSPSRRARTYM